MKNPKKKFFLRDEDEQERLVSEVWCTTCEEGDLGLLEPQEFEANGIVFLEGKCAQCGNEVVSEIAEPA